MSPAAALRERLTQTRARMARKPPQIDVEWDPEEQPTRRYEGESFFGSWRRGQRYDASPQARTRLGSGEVPIAPDPDSLEHQRSSTLPDTRPRGRARSAEVPIAPEPPPRERARSAEVPIAPPPAAARPAPRERARSAEVPAAPPSAAPHLTPSPRERTRSTEVPVASEQPTTLPASAPRERARSGEAPVAPPSAAPLPTPSPRGRVRSAEVPVAAERATVLPEAPRPRARVDTIEGWPSIGDPLDADEHTVPPRFEAPRPRTRSADVPVGTQFGEPTSVAPHASHALDPSTFPGWRPQKRVRDTPLRVEPELAEHIAPIGDTPTRPPLGTLFLREVSAVAEHLQGLYARIDHSERAVRNRVALCSGGLLLAAALSSLFSHEPTPDRQQPTAASAATPKPAPRTASVSISSEPTGAQIFVDGRASGKVTPASIGELTAGKHRIGLQLAGYSEATEALHLPEDALLSINLSPLGAPHVAPQPLENRPETRAEARTRARALARERRAAARAARVISRYRARMGLPAEPID